MNLLILIETPTCFANTTRPSLPVFFKNADPHRLFVKIPQQNRNVYSKFHQLFS